MRRTKYNNNELVMYIPSNRFVVIRQCNDHQFVGRYVDTGKRTEVKDLKYVRKATKEEAIQLFIQRKIDEVELKATSVMKHV